MNRINNWRSCYTRKGFAILALSVFSSTGMAAAATVAKPNILVIWGDDAGIWNISHNSRGMMG